MPLSPELEALLAAAPAEKREGIRKELEGGFMRQEDYSRKMNELGESEKVRSQAYESGKKWVDDNRTYYKEAMTQRDQAIQRAKDLETRLSSLESASKTPPKEEDINVADDVILAKALREAREDARAARAEAGRLAESVTKIDKMLTEGTLLTAEQFNTEAARRLEAYGEAIMEVLETRQKSVDEYGKPIDRKALLAEAAKYNGDLTKAYDSVTSDFRLEKLKKDIRADIEKEYEAKRIAEGSPLATGAPPLSLGPLQQRVYAAKNPDSTIDPSIPADGSGRLAHAMAAELRAEGKV